MTFTTHPTSSVEPLRAKSGWLIALGVLYVIAGVIALGSVVFATAASVFIVGVMMIIAGVAELIGAFQIRSWGGFLLVLLLGILFIAGGVSVIQNPLFAATVLTAVLGAVLVAAGIMRIAMAFSIRQAAPWIWVAISGVLTLLLGLIILAHWPVSSLYTLGIFLGVDLLFVGLGWIAAGFGLQGQRSGEVLPSSGRG